MKFKLYIYWPVKVVASAKMVVHLELPDFQVIADRTKRTIESGTLYENGVGISQGLRGPQTKKSDCSTLQHLWHYVNVAAYCLRTFSLS